jgi:hypothetical protein
MVLQFNPTLLVVGMSLKSMNDLSPILVEVLIIKVVITGADLTENP